MPFVPKRLSNDEPTVSIGVKVPLSVADQMSRLADAEGVTVSEVARRALVRGLPADGLILPEVVAPGEWQSGVVESRKGGTDARPAVHVPTEDGAVLVDQGSGEVVAELKGRPSKRPHRFQAIAPGSPVKKCSRCGVMEMAARTRGSDAPEFCGGV